MGALPLRQYIFTTGQIRSNYGGLTIAMMRRAKMFALAGHPVTITTIDMWPDYSELVRKWTASGVMIPGVSIRNIHDDFRELEDVRLYGAPFGQQEPPVLKVLASYRVWENPLDAGLKRFYFPPESPQHKLTEYLRQDGTVYMRTLSNPGKGEWDLPEKVVGIYDRKGHFAYYLTSHQRWWELWLRSISLESELKSVVINDCEHALFLGRAKAVQIPSIQFVHCAHTQTADPMSRLIERWVPLTFGQAPFDHVVFPTRAQQADWSMQVTDHVRSHVVPHAFEAPTEAPVIDQTNPRRCVIVSRLDKGKNLSAAIRIFHKAAADIDDATLDIYGEGNDQNHLRGLVEALGLGNKVTMHGYTPNAATRYAGARASVFTSDREGFGLSVLEALSHGCPVVSFDTKYGPADMVFDGVSGFLIRGKDEDSAATKLREILLDDDLAFTMKAASQKVAGRFSTEEALRGWSSVVLAASP